ncbi:aspartate/glutamate racemase family protein [Ancylobacter amanitiformis]|uniref:Asp/Glu/hydantoin racemase n=1 Tax=Ancylobacter amanitiformis TaxID=217069 RepID=A0ABU0LW71_9HYPH|nr:aspartate/glutamate racemase family protein [Ancylobacter amanitiformis]MDQ0512935.1 Asp/Glu/hydantoin racemase [Ancylobacter amanitiformis]
MAAAPRIALIHATPVAVEPIQKVLASDWPDAEPFNLLDDSLSPDLARAGEISEGLTERIVGLARYARSTGADGILFTCSAFGSAIATAARLLDIPVLKPNEAMFEAAMDQGSKVAMIVTFAPAQASMEAEFAEEAERLGSAARLTSFVAEGAMAALRAGDAPAHHALVAEQARAINGFDAIMLAHFSTAPAAAAVRAAVSVPILTSPEAAVAKLRRLFRS